MNKVTLNKDGSKQLSWGLLIKVLKKNLLLVILIPLLITVFGSIVALATSKDLYASTGALLFTNPTHQSSILAMANMAESDLVYNKTCESLKNENVQINGNLSYTSNDLREITKITPIVTSNKIEIKCTSKEKDIVKIIVDKLLDNSIQYGIDYPLFKDNITINNYGTNPTLISSGLPYKFLASFGASLIVTFIALVIKQRLNRRIMDVEELKYLGLTPVVLKKNFNEKAIAFLNKELEVLDSMDSRIFITISPKDTFKIEYEKMLKDMKLDNKILFIDLVHSNDKIDFKEEYELQKISKKIDALYFKNPMLGILKFKDCSFSQYVKELSNNYDKIFIICGDNAYNSDLFLLYEFTRNIIVLLEKDVTNLNSFITTYERLPEDACITTVLIEL